MTTAEPLAKAAEAPLTLYGDRFWISPYVFTCFVALREKGLDFRVSPVALDRREQLDPAFRDASLTARVPALLDGGFWLSESTAIVEYLEERYREAGRLDLLPMPIEERARARQLMAWLRSDLGALREERSTATMFYQRAERPLSPDGQAAADKLVRVAEALIGPARTVLFSTWSIADADLAFALHRLLLNGHEVPAPVRAYAHAQWQRPSVREFVTHERPEYVPY